MTGTDDLLLARIVDEAVAGKRVVVVGASRADVQSLFHSIVERDVESVIRVNGRERITFRSGGLIHFVNARGHGCRGMTADVVFVHGWNDLSEDQRQEIAPIANHGEIIRA